MQRTIDIFRAAGQRFAKDGCGFLAQAIAYNALFSTLPLAVLAVAALAFVYGSQDGQARALGIVDDFAPAFHDLLADNLKSVVSLRNISGIVGAAALVWSGKNLFQALAYALNRALGVQTARPFVHDIVLSIVMLPVIGILLIVATALPPLVSVLARLTHLAVPFAELTSYAISILLIFAIAAILYTFLPNRSVSWRFSLPGAAFSTVAYVVVQGAFTLYAEHTNLLHVYGVISTVLALLLWFYLMGAIFLYGALLCAEYAGNSVGSMSRRSADSARPATEA